MKSIKSKIHTLLYNAKLQLKGYLLGFAVVCAVFFGIEFEIISFAQTSSGTVLVESNAGNYQNKITYSNDGGSVVYFTTYLPPSGTYNTGEEHSLPSCQQLTVDSLDRIGKVCMIRIPKPCSGPSDPNRGISCLVYGDIFTVDASGRNKSPKKCQGSLVEGRNCLTVNKPYCHNVEDPILGINCKLAPCTHIPNTKYPRPGVNCLAECNQFASTEAQSLGFTPPFSQPKFFMEGFNCLSSCRNVANPKIGENCVLEFKDYPLPFCKNQTGFFAHYNIANSTVGPREQCIDLKDLPLCSIDNGLTQNVSCAKNCNPTSPSDSHGDNCIDKNIEKMCHHQDASLDGCNRIKCSNLSPGELRNSLNSNKFLGDTSSTEVYCRAVDPYTSFTYKQLSSVGYNGYLRDYSLADVPCGSLGGTEEHIAITSSSYYVSSPVNDTFGRPKDLLGLVKDHCLGSDPYLQSTTMNPNYCRAEWIDPNLDTYKKELLYNTISSCRSLNAIQAISCRDYENSPTQKPYDCNSPIMANTRSAECSASNPTCYCNANQEYCYKVDLDCTLPANSVYPICRQILDSNYTPDTGDDTVSWFFRPNLPWEALVEYSENGVTKYKTKRMEGYPITPASSNQPNGNLSIPYWMIKDMGMVDAVGIFTGTISPSCQANQLGTRGIGLPYICGMGSDFRSIPSNEASYFKGEVETIFGENNSFDHRVTVCVRSMNSGALRINGKDTSCGSRKCRCDCSISGCAGAWCGSDICRTVSIKSSQNGDEISPCKSDAEHFYYNNPDFAAQFASNPLLFLTVGMPMEADSASRRTKPCMTTFQDSSDNEMRLVRVRAYKPRPDLNYICAVTEHFGITADIPSAQRFFDGDEYFLVPVDNVPLIEGKRPYQKLCVSGKLSKTGKCEYGFNTLNDKYNTQVWRTARVVKYAMQPPTKEGYGDENDDSNTNLERDEATGYFTIKDQGIEYDEVDSAGNIVMNSKLGGINYTIGRKGFYKKHLYEKSDCIKHTMRVSTPIMYAEGDRFNSRRLFLPPIRISRICASSSDCSSDATKQTDFYKSAVQIIWGQAEQATPSSSTTSVTNYKFIQIDANRKESEAYTIVPMGVGFDISDGIVNKVVLKKEFDIDKNPTVCLYQRVESTNPQVPHSDSLIKCVGRTRATKLTMSAVGNSRAYNNYGFNVGYTETGISGLSTTNYEFTKITNFANLQNLKLCNNNTSEQGFPVCLVRDKCTMLNYECIENERDYIIEKYRPEPDRALIRQYEYVSNYCKKVLLPSCNELRGLPKTVLNSTLNTSVVNGFNAPAQNNHYGWYNEVCITSGIESLDDLTKKKYVIQNIPTTSDGTPDSGAMGTCVTRSGSSECQLYDQLPPAGANQSVRFATPRELGLCFELNNYLKTCLPVSFGTNTDPSDPYYTANLDNPHSSHTLRTNNAFHADFDISFPTNTILGTCNGFWKSGQNFPTADCDANGNLINIRNACIRFSCPTLTTPSYGADSSGDYPLSYDSSPTSMKSARGRFHGYALWSGMESRDVKQDASAQSCLVGYRPANSTIISKNSILTNSLISVTTKNYFRNLPDDDQNKLAIQSLYEDISGYSAGTRATRKCNQLGDWEDVANPCERITCPALDFPKPADAGSFDMNDFQISINGNLIKSIDSPNSTLPTKVKFKLTSSINTNPINLNPTASPGYNNLPLKSYDGITNITQISANVTYVFELVGQTHWKRLDNSSDEIYRGLWSSIGGAKFPKGYAWRSTNYIYTPQASDVADKHIVKGECQNDLGYRKLASNPDPQLFCDFNGNWNIRNLRNQCISDCSAVSSPTAIDIVHGFSEWNKSSAQVGSSETVSSKGCVAGYIRYPYDAPYDEEGNKGDFGYQSNTRNAVVNLGITNDSYDGIATTSDGSKYQANNLPESAYNFNGTFYDLKISSQSPNGGLSQNSDVGDFTFQLFNSSNITLTSAPNTVWSKVKFASYGTPNYVNITQPLIDNACHSQYSKLIAAKNCIGQTSCSLNLSQFSNYDPLGCDNISHKGNAQNGATTTTESYGSGGGGGGGNSFDPGSAGGNAGQNGLVGTSFCDKNVHLDYNCNLALATNKGAKVDLTQPASNSEGGTGSVIIKYYNNSTCSGTPTETISFLSSGSTSYNIPGDSSSQYCIEYEAIGGGGGGGGAGTNFGTDGSGGTKVSGKFLTNGGKVMTIYVGAGGKAGKTGCIRPSSGATSSLDNYHKNYPLTPEQIAPEQLALGQIATSNTKTLATNSETTNSLVKILSKISDIFISESYAAHCEWNLTGIGWVGLERGQTTTRDCSNEYTGSVYFDCKSTCSKEVCLYTGSYDGTMKCFNVVDEWYIIKNLWNDIGFPNDSLSSISTNSNVDWTYYEHQDRGGASCTGSGSTSGKNSWGDWVKLTGSGDCNHDMASSFQAKVKSCSSSYSGGCSPVSCSWNVNFGNSYRTISTGYTTGSSQGCDTGYSGSYNYSCTRGGSSISGSCTRINCYLNGGNGFDGRNVDFSDYSNTKSVSCDKTGYSGSVTYYCTINGSTVNASSSCSCATNYTSNGSSCVPQCSLNSATGYTPSAGLKVFGNNFVYCNGTNFNSSNTLAYNCTTAGATITPSGTCNCNSGFTLTGSGTSATCNQNCPIDVTTYSGKYGFTVNNGDFAVRSGANKTYTCTGTEYANSSTATFSCNSLGALSFTSCNCASGYLKYSSTYQYVSFTYPSGKDAYNCLRKCNVLDTTSTSWGTGSVTYDILEGTTTKSCSGTGYSTSNATLNCSSGGSATITAGCTCASTHAKSIPANYPNHTAPANTSSITWATGANGSCFKKCTVSATTSTSWGTGTSTYDILQGTTTKACSGTGYSASNATLSCDINNGASISASGCTCASGYLKYSASYSFQGFNPVSGKNITNSCFKKCTVSATTSTSWGTGPNAYDILEGTTTKSCTTTGYTGESQIGCNADGSTSVISKCPCATGYARNASDTCVPITCNIQEGVGYLAQTGLAYTGPSSYGTVKCLKDGFYGYVNYRCNDNSPPSPTGYGTILTGSGNPSCQGVACAMPTEANSEIAPGTLLNWSATPTSFTCKTGYKSPGNGLTPTYQCVYTRNSDSGNTLASLSTIIENACIIVTCNLSPIGFVQYSSTEQMINCRSYSNAYYGDGKYTCAANGVGTWITPCKQVSCQIPTCTSCTPTATTPCPACQGPAQNSTDDGRVIYYSPGAVNLRCKDGYDYTAQPTYKCIYDSNTNASKLELGGSPCQIIKCNANDDLKSVIDGTQVEWTNSAFVTTSCKEGFYSTSAGSPPKYSCNSQKIYTVQNPCSPIKCTIASSTANKFGMQVGSEIDWSSASKIISCNKPGFSGTITYTCTGTSSSNAILAISNNSCVEQVCDPNYGSKNTSTFNSLVNSSGSGDGGAGGTSDSFDFLKGGSGGNSSLSFTSGAGGGGGQASMIAIDNKIIVIAGGGSGGAGGGASANIGSNQNYILSERLNSNIFGNYLVLKIGNIRMWNNPQETAGINYSTSLNDQIIHSAPTGKFINDIIFSSYGNPTLPASADSSPFNLKHGTCTSPSQAYVENMCLSKNSCTIDNLNQTLNTTCQSVPSPSMGILSSYIYAEPTLNVNSRGELRIREFSAGDDLIIANLVNGKVYSFYKTGDQWIKYDYAVRDEFMATSATAVSEIRVKFHRSNSTFEPKLKIVNAQENILVAPMQIKKSSTEDLSIGYIKPNIDYILRNKGGYWEIKKYINEYANVLSDADRTLPKRTCMTIRMLNSSSTSWSGTNSTCINQCPSGEYDDRIGAGATLHQTSYGTGKIKWPATAFGTYAIKTFDSTPVNGEFKLKSPDGSPPFVTTPNMFANAPKGFFILARYCGSDGVWQDPTSLCAVGGGSSSDASTIPPSSTSDNIYLKNETTNPNPTFNNSVKYMQAESSDRAGTGCLDGFDPTTGSSNELYNSQFISDTPSYRCKRNGAEEDKIYLEKIPNDYAKGCIRYCAITDLMTKPNYGLKYDAGSYVGKKVRPGYSVSLNCNTANRYGTNEISSTSSSYSATDSNLEAYVTQPTNENQWKAWRNRNDSPKPTFTLQSYSYSSARPTFECQLSGTNGIWSNFVINDCTTYNDCNVDNIVEYQGLWYDLGSGSFFPLKKFLAKNIPNKTLTHGQIYTFPEDSSVVTKKYGLCGYCVYGCGAYGAGTGFSDRCYRKIYLKKVECSNGRFIPTWESSREGGACDGDPFDHQYEYEEGHPSQSYLGYCSENTTDTNNFNEITTP